jgi:hypothetical protein
VVIFYRKIVDNFDIYECDIQYYVRPGKLFTGVFQIKIHDNDRLALNYKSGLYILGIHIIQEIVYNW